MFAVPSSAFLPFQVLSFQVRRSKFCAFCGKNVRRSKFCFFCRSKWLQLERRSKFGFSRSKCCSFQVRRSKSCAPHIFDRDCGATCGDCANDQNRQLCNERRHALSRRKHWNDGSDKLICDVSCHICRVLRRAVGRGLVFERCTDCH